MKPVIVLAFANDRDDYLPMVTRERKSIFKALQDYDDKGFIRVHKEENTAVEDIFELFNRYRDQVAIFHYGGHANSTHLQLETVAGESQMADALGLARLMGRQKNLQLVFLNGCATKKQVELLLSAGVRAVIATCVPIDDRMAVEFAERFYNTLASPSTIREAFQIASAFITTKYGAAKEINVYRDVSWQGKKGRAKGELPWGLYVAAKNQEVLEWKLPTSSRDAVLVSGETTLDEMKGTQIEEIIAIAIQVVQGLEKAYHKGVVHKNIRPRNIILDESKRVKILDFSSEELPETSHYISPEQARGEALDMQSTIWSLGVVLYETVTGQLPFEGEHEQAVIHSIINDSPLPPTELRDDVPAGLEKIIFKCLRKERRYRYPSLQPLSFELKNLGESLREEDEAKPEQPEIPATRELRQVTVMFGEISGYNEMLEKLGAEEAVSIMDSCFKMIYSTVEKYGGKIDQILGKRFTVFFGLPTAIEDASRKAVHAAIEMRGNLYQLNREKNLRIPLDIRMGIDAGTVIAAIGADEKQDDMYNATGVPLTLASRLEDLAAEGEIYVGPSIYRYTRDDFEYDPVKPVTLEGRTEPVPAFELLSIKKKIHRPRLSAERMIDSEMVGRDKELDKLRLHMLKVINGEGSIVSVIGEAGIGKSRLIDELKGIEDIKKVTLLEGSSLSIGKNLSYHPLIDMLKNWAEIKDEESEKGALSKLEQAITTIYPDGAEEVFPFVAILMGMKLTGKYAERVKGIETDALEKLILKNLRELMIKISEHHPLVCILHDTHWADLSSIEIFESFFRLAERHKILFINVFRPNYQETSERLLETTRERYGRIHAEIQLEPLGKKECETLIKNLVKASGLPTDVIAAITNRAEGNPFFIEEVARSFIDEGVIELKDGEFKVSGKIGSVVIPETIQDVLMARIDRLDMATRALLKRASVIGRYFFYKILAEVVKTIDNIDDKLEYLKGIQLIRERERLQESEYFFKHAVAWQVTYESILLKRRKEHHLDVAAAIESVFSQRLREFYGMLSFHYSKGENLEKAEEYLIKAGEEALKSAASREALNYYQEALDLYLKKSGDAADPEKIAMLEKNIGLAFYNKGHYDEAVIHFDRAFACWGEIRPRNKFFALLKLAADLLILLKSIYFPSKKVKRISCRRDSEWVYLAGKRSGALALVDQNRMFMESIGIIRRLRKLDITKLEDGIFCYAGISAIFSETGLSFKIGKKLLDYVKNYISENDIRSFLVYNFSLKLHNLFSGNWNEGFEYDESFIDVMLNIGEFLYVSSFITLHVSLETARGNFDKAGILTEKLAEIGEAYDNDFVRTNKCAITAFRLFKCRKLYDALNEVDTGIYLVNKIGQTIYALSMSGLKSYIQIVQGDIKGTEKSLLQAKEIASHEKRASPGQICFLLMSQSLFDLYILEKSVNSKNKIKMTGLSKKAYRSVKAAVKNSYKDAGTKPETFRFMGVYYWLIGKQRKALTWWNKSIHIGEFLGARPELARTYMEVGKRLLEEKSKHKQLNGIQAGEYLKKARLLFEEMDLSWDLEQLDKITSQVDES